MYIYPTILSFFTAEYKVNFNIGFLFLKECQWGKLVIYSLDVFLPDLPLWGAHCHHQRAEQASKRCRQSQTGSKWWMEPEKNWVWRTWELTKMLILFLSYVWNKYKLRKIVIAFLCFLACFLSAPPVSRRVCPSVWYDRGRIWPAGPVEEEWAQKAGPTVLIPDKREKHKERLDEL